MSSHSRTAFPSLTTLLALFFHFTTAMSAFEYDYCSTQNTGLGQAYRDNFQTGGSCSDHCKAQGGAAYAVISYKNCWCSNYAPSEESQVGIENCSNVCPGYGDEICGNDDETYVYVVLDGNPSGTAAAAQPSSTQSPSSKPSSTSDPITSTSAAPPPPKTSTPAPETSTQLSTITNEAGSTLISIITVIRTPSATATVPEQSTQPEQQAESGQSSSQTGAIAGGAVGGVFGLALIIGAVFLLLRRRRKQRNEAGDDSGEPRVQRYASTMSKSGLLRTEKEPTLPPPIATSGYSTKRQSRAMDQGSISPISASDRQNSSFRVDQRLNPSTVFVFDDESRASIGSLDDTRDYHRTLNVRNPDFDR